MSIPEELGESKGRALLGRLKGYFPQLYVPLVLILVGVASFSLGRLSVNNQRIEGVKIITSGSQNSANLIESKTSSLEGESFNINTINTENTEVVASKNGSVYYLPWCSGVSRIKPENLVNFKTVEEARRQGYKPSATCKGIK